ncbi:isochorismatase [Salipaludibacillus sp. HK11]|uniref:isochorismatase n=1 Tax=Salipaludibacillus sp. HK11 TaxID=3394320 RepID=UPI0039FBF6B2
MFTVKEKYVPRPIRFIELWEIEGWKIKVYGISTKKEYPDKNNIVLGKKIAVEQLNNIEIQTEIYQLGFIIIHETQEGVFILIDYWTGENMLCNHAFYKDYNSTTISYLTPTGLTACVWELRIINFERNAWVEHILLNDQDVNINNYLKDALNEDI